jgi:hypothetical protein
MPCPRCDAAVDPHARSCPACALPLTFDDEPAPALEVTLELDRRAAVRGDLSLPRPHVARGMADPLPRREKQRDGHLQLDPLPDPPPPRGRESKGRDLAPDPDFDAALAPARTPPAGLLRRAAAWALDGAVVALAAALPVALASRGIATVDVSLSALALPATGFFVLLGASYVVLSRLLAGATLGKLAFAPRTDREADAPAAPSRPLVVRAP